ncbi:YhgE/Pip domain-containing protein [Arthrobacter sp. 7Tela_A1]|uniref:YhgE/Pip domain-containing protein n=1 Tax=Arthrobacter sp. 7Tela_A1 TaxID=3093745 RepID=UPI003BB48BF7
MPSSVPGSSGGTTAAGTSSGTTGSGIGAYLSPRTWLLPLFVLLLLGGTGSALYIGGLGSPAGHLEHVPVALVNRDDGTDASGTQEDFGRDLAGTLKENFDKTDDFDMRPLSWDEAQAQLRSGQVYAAVVLEEDFSADAVGLVSSSLTDTEATRPHITFYTNPLASPLGSQLAADAIVPALDEASRNLGEQLEESAEQARAEAQERQGAELTEAGVPEEVQSQLAPQLNGTSTAVLSDPIQITERPFEKPQEGSALGMGAFFYSVLLMVVGISGSVALHFLVDSRLGVLPIELGPRFRRGPLLRPARWATFLLKWGIVLVAGLPTAGLMMWIASAVGMPIPHGGLFFFSSWLCLATVSAVTFGLITLFGSAGMILSMIYIVFMGLPAATGVVPLEMLPGFFKFIARGEPLYQMTIANKAILYFDAQAGAGLQAGLIGMGVIILVFVVAALVAGVVYDRLLGTRAADLELEKRAARH